MYVGLVMILALGIRIFFNSSHDKLRILVGVVLILMFIFIVISLFMHKRSFEEQGVFLTIASKMISTSGIWLFLYIPLFLACMMGFIIILIMELRAIWGGGTLRFDAKESVYWQYDSIRT